MWLHLTGTSPTALAPSWCSLGVAPGVGLQHVGRPGARAPPAGTQLLIMHLSHPHRGTSGATVGSVLEKSCMHVAQPASSLRGVSCMGFRPQTALVGLPVPSALDDSGGAGPGKVPKPASPHQGPLSQKWERPEARGEGVLHACLLLLTLVAAGSCRVPLP